MECCYVENGFCYHGFFIYITPLFHYSNTPFISFSEAVKSVPYDFWYPHRRYDVIFSHRVR